MILKLFVLQNTPERKRGSRPQSLTGSGIANEFASTLSIPKEPNDIRQRADSNVSLQPIKKSRSFLSFQLCIVLEVFELNLPVVN